MKEAVKTENRARFAIQYFREDYVDDEDQADGFIFNRWYADMVRKGMPIEWNDLLD